LALRTCATPIGLVGSDDKRSDAVPHSDSGRRAIFDALPTPGIYRALVQTHGVWNDAPTLSVAVNPSLAESDFSPIKAEEVADALGGQEHDAPMLVQNAGANIDPFKARGWASYFLVVLFIAFVLESLLAVRG